jgi:hypothetical protein
VGKRKKAFHRQAHALSEPRSKIFGGLWANKLDAKNPKKFCHNIDQSRIAFASTSHIDALDHRQGQTDLESRVVRSGGHHKAHV